MVAIYPCIAENCTLGLVGGLFGNQQNQVLVISRLNEGIDYCFYAIAGFSCPASAKYKLNRHKNNPCI